MQDSLDPQRSEVVGYDLPDARVLHVGAVVAQHVAEVGDAAPGYLRVALLGLARNVTRSLADDFQAALDGTAAPLVRQVSSNVLSAVKVSMAAMASRVCRSRSAEARRVVRTP
jgi:hypothetical protein